MHIKEMPASERPQEKLLFGGARGLSNSELLALIIRTGTGKKSAIRLADEVIAYTSDNIGELGMAEVRELTEIEGIGEAKACSIVAAMELSKRLMPRIKKAPKAKSSRVREEMIFASVISRIPQMRNVLALDRISFLGWA